MSLCSQCGNALIHGCGPICLVCQHTGRHEQTATEKLMVANLDATYKALETVTEPSQCKCCGFCCPPKEEFCGQCRTLEDGEADPVAVVWEAQLRIGVRNSRNTHSRVRPDLGADAGEERERQPVCQSCNGTGRNLAQRCPDCSEDGDREQD